MSERKPRISLHPDQDYISIGFEGTNDTLLKMPSRPEGWGDHAVAVEWVAAINVALDLAGAREIDCPDCGSPYDENCADCDVPAGWISLAAQRSGGRRLMVPTLMSTRKRCSTSSSLCLGRRPDENR